MLERLGLKSPIQRTSQRVKRTSGARDVIFFSSEMMGGGGFTVSLISKPWLEIMGGRAFFSLDMMGGEGSLRRGDGSLFP